LEGKYFKAGLCGSLRALPMGESVGIQCCRQCAPATPRRGRICAISIRKTAFISFLNVICKYMGQDITEGLRLSIERLKTLLGFFQPIPCRWVWPRRLHVNAFVDPAMFPPFFW
jgi:hypothetical protein